jgi:hypothetical protein
MRIVPSAKGGRRLDGNALFSFEVHGIHLGSYAILSPHIVNGVDPTSIVQDALRQSCFATGEDEREPTKMRMLYKMPDRGTRVPINVSRDPNVSQM